MRHFFLILLFIVSNFKKISKVFLLVMLSFSGTLTAQITFKTEYFGKSSYRVQEGDNDTKVGDSKGSAMVYQGGINIPLSTKLNEANQPTLWSLGGGATYTRLHNKNFTEPLVIDEILNLGLNINHLRPISDRWSMMLSLGGGAYMPTTRLSQLRFKNILGNLGAIFIYHFKPNLELGGGVAFNNSFGFPMVFPAFYVNWSLNGRYMVNVDMLAGLNISAGYNFNKFFSIHIVAEMNGQMALLEVEGKDKIFSHQYIITGLRPEFKIGNKISIPITLGINAIRPTELMDRKLKSLFKSKGYYFQISPYASVGLSIGF